MKHWKSISATLLAATLVTSTAGQAWADETEKVDSSTFETVDLQEALENVKDETVTSEDLEVISSIVPVGYIANNITALSLNLEKISNPRAKEALQKNIDRAIARWEAKNKVEEEETEVETPVVVVPPIVELPTTEEDEVTPTPEAEEVTPVAVVSEDEETETEDEEKTDAEKEAKKAEIAAKKEAKKAEIAAKKEAKKAEIAEKKEAKKAEKEERKANKEAKNENKGNKDRE